MLTIKPIPALHDNYIWMILHPASQQVLIVDPGEAAPVIDVLKRDHLQLAAILITHHHWDHTGGVDGLLKYKNVPVYGPKSITSITHPVKAGDTVVFEALDCQFEVIEIPGHTLDHIAYVGEAAVFCGDTLFTGGCGRLFEGTAEQMFESLTKLAALPPETQVYCAHEYTEANLRFANAVEPENTDLLQRIDEVSTLRLKNQPTVPATLELELKTNPFLRSHEPSVQGVASERVGETLTDPMQIFAEIRRWKDGF